MFSLASTLKLSSTDATTENQAYDVKFHIVL